MRKKAIDVLKEIKKGEVHRLYLLTGENGDYLKKQIIQNIVSLKISKGFESFDYIVIAGNNTSSNEVYDALKSPPYGNGKVIVIRNAEKIKKRDFKKILETKVPEDTVLIILFDETTTQSPLEKDSVIVDDYSITSTMLKKWIRDKVKMYGKKIENEAVSALLERLDGDLFIISSEIKKLALFTEERKVISKKDVEIVVKYIPEIKVFHLVDLIVNNKKSEALKTFNQFTKDENASPEQILSLLLRSFMHLITIKELLLTNIRVSEIAQKGNIHPSFIVKKLLPIAKSSDLNDIIEKFHTLKNIDVESKKGETEIPLALKLFIENY